MADDGELGLRLEVRRKHLDIHTLALRGSAVLIFVVLVVGPTVEIGRDLVFIRFTMQGPSLEHFSHVARGELMQLLVVAKDDNSHIDRAEHGQFIGLLEQTSLPLQKGDRAVPFILDRFDIDLPATHCDGGATAETPAVSKRCSCGRMWQS
jgi:hypothetical protein